MAGPAGTPWPFAMGFAHIRLLLIRVVSHYLYQVTWCINRVELIMSVIDLLPQYTMGVQINGLISNILSRYIISPSYYNIV